MTKVRAAFGPEVVRLQTADLIPLKEVRPRERTHPKYQQIVASLSAVGLIEPLVVFPIGTRYRVLDGNKRLDILRTQKVQEIECLIGTTDEGYTYNRRVNYLSTIGEHQMILRALRHNSAETIARSLNVDVSTIKQKQNLLDGICKEAADILKDRRVHPKAFAAMRKMKPVRQVAAAQFMVASNMYSKVFVQALVAGTSDEMLVEPRSDYKSKSLSTEQRTRLIAETDLVLSNLKTIESTYGQEALTLNVCCRYIGKILSDKVLFDYLGTQHPEIRIELQLLAESLSEQSTVIS